MSLSEIRDFQVSVARLLARQWGTATSAKINDLDQLWESAIDGGWYELASESALPALVAAATELGKVACPLPLADGFVAARLWGPKSDVAKHISDGTWRITAVPAETPNRFVEAGESATHVLLLSATSGTASVHRITGCNKTDGLAKPDWSAITYGEPEAEIEADAHALDEAIVIIRLTLAARARGASSRTHSLALEHAKQRIQFGKPIGSFGAVQQRAATCQIDVAAADLLIDRALEAFDAGSSQWRLCSELAVDFVSDSARRVQFGAHHTLAAMGYFEEHDGPWLFRRIHADLLRLQLFPRTAGSVADVLVETDSSLPSFALDTVGEEFRQEVRSVIDSLRGPSGPDDFDEQAAVNALASRGWLGFGWPEEASGRSASLSEQVALNDEITYHRLPVTSQTAAVMLQGDSILQHGTTEQKDRFLPAIRQGKLRACLGYSEPEVGSDLASLRTRADRDDDEWVINGQKIWTTAGHTAEYVWLAARTDQDAKPRHAGITMFLVPMNTPGIDIQPMTALSGEISCVVFYDNVRVSDSCRVGEINGGWKVITGALAGERVLMGGIAAQLHRQLDDLLATVREDVNALVGPRGSAKRARLGKIASTLQATRALVASAISATSRGDGARLEAPMAAVLGGELAEDFGEAMLDILGPDAALGAPVPGTPGGGAFEKGLRLSIMYVVGGGTNDIQRGLIARGLGLPR
ncbi:acyl-CoA dehydrogenase family protein [Rhodococcus erythropolis]|uniref:acyl-CoA dehydrogenase family protein n=1 Tax=Rhodococcus erythropolis TaxID=1833 RepID=UPI00379F8802